MLLIRAALFLGLVQGQAAVKPDEETLARGRQIYFSNCLICHQANGQGTPGTFPPLAKSDFLVKERDRSIKAVLEGLSGEIRVNGRKYHGTMPPAVLDDEDVALLFTFMLNSWGNPGGTVTEDEVRKLRTTTAYPTFRDLTRANYFAPLPKPPEGFKLREVVRLTEHGIRLVKGPEGVLYVLSSGGNVFRLDPAKNSLTQTIWSRNYLGQGDTWGIAIDSQNRMYIAANQRDESGALVTNRVTIFRSTETDNGNPVTPRPWFKTAYPWGVGPFNHCVNTLGIGPDGMLYVNSGSRTDGNEPGQDPKYWKGGEHPLTACIWRFDLTRDTPELEVFARGLRNAFGFTWNRNGEMFATDNGPDADAPEELNLIERGKHYGFPYQFSNWSRKPYAHTPTPPANLQITQPIPNLGPDGGFSKDPIFTFDPHSSPAGICFLGDDFPDPYRGGFLVARVGNLMKTPRDVGFDLLFVKLSKDARGKYQASVRTLLGPLGRPIDVLAAGDGKAYILEYTRPANNSGALGFPGRVLEFSVAAK